MAIGSDLTSHSIARRRSTSLVSRLCAVGVFLVFAFHLVSLFLYQSRVRGDRLHDFPTFYAAAQLALSHGDIYTAGSTPDVRYVYPPLIAVVFTPLTRVSLLNAAHIFLLLNVLMICGSISLATKAILSRFGMDSKSVFWPVVLLCTLLSVTQTRNVLVMGETDVLMLFLFTLAFYWVDSLPILTGLAIGFAFNIKYLPIIAIPYFLLRRRWTAAIFSVLGSILFALVPALLLGWHETIRDLRVSMGGLLLWFGVSPEQTHSIRVHNIADDLSVSLTSALARVLEPHGFSNSAVMIVAAMIGVVVMVVVGRMYRRRGFSVFSWPDRLRQMQHPFRDLVALEWPGLVTAALVFSPDTNTRHLVIGVLVNVLASVLLVNLPLRVTRMALAGVVIIFVTYTMPFGRASAAMHQFYYRYSLPGCGLLVGYLLILWTGLSCTAEPRPAQSSPRSAAM